MANIRNNGLNSSALFNTTLFTPETKYRIQQWEIPGVELDHPILTTKVGIINMQGSTLEYQPLSMQLLLDEGLETWKEVMQVFQTYHIPGTNTCEPLVGESWVEIYNSKNKYLFKIQFHNCYLKTLGNVQYTSMDDNEVLTMDLSLVYDYYTIES